MKKIKHFFVALCCVMLLGLAFPLQAFAADIINMDQPVRLTISYTREDLALTGATFELYLVAAADAYGELTATAEFEPYYENIRGKNDEAWRTLASTLEGVVQVNQYQPYAEGKTDLNGKLTFDVGAKGMTKGLYLVMGSTHTQGKYVYTSEPFMVLLPARDRETDAWLYDVTVKPKNSAVKDPSLITKKVLKVWEDNGFVQHRPSSVTVHLLKNGAIVDTVKLTAENNWRHTWADLENTARWTVTEEPVEGYLPPEITLEGITYKIVNTYDTPDQPDIPDKPDKPDLPATGGSWWEMWWPVPVMAVSGMLLILVGLLYRRGEADEE